MTAYLRPATLDEALAIRAARPVDILSGGTDVYPARTTRAGWGRMAHADVLDLSAIPGLDWIEETGTHWRFGARVTWSQIASASLPPAFDGLRAAAREVGGIQIQNRGTVVGNLCTASPAGDGIPNLMVLEAEVEIAGPSGRKSMPVESFLAGYRKTALGADEIVTGLVVPKPASSARGAFRKLGARRYLVISIAMVAGLIEIDEAGLVQEVRLCVGACSAVAARLRDLEARLRGMPLTRAAEAVRPEDFAALSPLDDVRASAAYRLAAAEVLTRDLLADLAGSSARRAA